MREQSRRTTDLTRGSATRCRLTPNGAVALTASCHHVATARGSFGALPDKAIRLTAMTEHELEMDSGEGVPPCCDLSALDVTQRKRRSLLVQLLQVGTVDIIELPDGYAFHMAPLSIIAKHLEEFAVFERLCCPFLTIVVRAARQVRGRYWKSAVVQPSGIHRCRVRRQKTTNDVTPSAHLTAGHSGAGTDMGKTGHVRLPSREAQSDTLISYQRSIARARAAFSSIRRSQRATACPRRAGRSASEVLAHPVRLARSSRFGASELQHLEQLVIAHEQLFLRAWNGYFTITD